MLVAYWRKYRSLLCFLGNIHCSVIVYSCRNICWQLEEERKQAVSAVKGSQTTHGFRTFMCMLLILQFTSTKGMCDFLPLDLVCWNNWDGLQRENPVLTV